MPEDNQTKWVGVRPVNPAENIPVSLVGSVACVKVEPCTPATEFKTLTKKRAPAIGDLQSPTGFVRIHQKINNVGAPSYNHDIYTVPAGSMFRLEFISAFCWQADPTSIGFDLWDGVTGYQWYFSAYGGAFEIHRQTLPIIYDQNEVVRIAWVGTLAATDVEGLMFGHLLDRY